MNQLRHESRSESHQGPAVEDLVLRNYDGESSHHVWINLVADGGRILEETYRLAPGETESVVDAVPSGEYDVEVSVDDVRRSVARCRVGDDPGEGILIELGNGVVSITDEVY